MVSTMSNFIANLLVASLILWTHLDPSTGQDYDDDYGGLSNETKSNIDWDYEALVAVRWDIADLPKIEYNNLRFDISFSVSDYIEVNKHVRYEMYQDAKCDDPSNIISDGDGYMLTWVTDDDTPVGTGLLAKRIVTVSNQLIAKNIRKSKSYREGDGFSGYGGDSRITYCVRFSLWDGEGPFDPFAVEVNYMTVTIELNLDFIDESFSITGQDVMARKKHIEKSDDHFFVEAFVCDENGNHISLTRPINQGETVRICVQPTKQALGVGFRMKRIERFYFIQGLASQTAVLNARISSNMLTILECRRGARQCWLETLLFSHFFEQGSVGTLIGNGEATLQWGGEGVSRRLQTDLGSELARIKNMKGDELIEIEVDIRRLQKRTSTKTIQVPTFTVLADRGTKRPRLLTDVKKLAMAKKIVLMLLIMILVVVSFLPMVHYYTMEPLESPEEDTDETFTLQPEVVQHEVGQPGSEVSVFDDFDRWMNSIIPDDRTMVSIKSFLSKGFS